MAPKRIIIDDRNINRKNGKKIDSLADAQLIELSQIPFGKKLGYAARYFADHSNNCYCREKLVLPTSEYLIANENSSADEEASICTCPLDHPCISSHPNRNKTAPCLPKDFSKNTELNYTEQRTKYELHNNPTKCIHQKPNYSEKATYSTPEISKLRNFRNDYFFDTHAARNKNPSSSSLDNYSITAEKKQHNKSSHSKDINSNSDLLLAKHRCVYSFGLNSRLKPIPLHADCFGTSCCDICNKPMSIRGINDTQKDTQNASSSQFNHSNDIKSADSIRNNVSEAEDKGEPQKIHIGSGDERIQLRIPNGLFEESIGHSVEVASFGGQSKGSKASKRQGNGTISWNNSGRGGAGNSAERANSFGLRQQKFSVYSK